jgi:nitric oxide reductase activation protein
VPKAANLLACATTPLRFVPTSSFPYVAATTTLTPMHVTHKELAFWITREELVQPLAQVRAAASTKRVVRTDAHRVAITKAIVRRVQRETGFVRKAATLLASVTMPLRRVPNL